MSSLTTLTAGIAPAALLQVQGRSPRTTQAYRIAVRRFIAWAGSGPVTVERFAEYITGLHAGASTVNRDLYGGKAAIIQAGIAQGMPARELAVLKTALDAIPAMKPGSPEVRVLSAEERKAIEAGLGLRMALLCRFLYATACRISEAVNVWECDIEVKDTTARIRIKGKGNKERHVRIMRQLLEEINVSYERPGRLLLFETEKGGPMGREYVTHSIQTAARKAIGRTVSAHDYRHSRATDLYQKHGRIKAVAEYLGHADTVTTARYYVLDRFTDKELTKYAPRRS